MMIFWHVAIRGNNVQWIQEWGDGDLFGELE